MLVEERQPIGNIGENVATSRSSVRGLRRPTEQPTASDMEDICGPATEGLYAGFLGAQEKSDTADLQPQPKRARLGKTRASAGGGLAKFACKS